MRLLLRGPSAIEVISTPAGSAHQIQASAATTGDWLQGQYIYSLRATKGDDVFEIENGRVSVGSSFANISAGTDVRHQAERTLANIEAVIENRATQDQQRYVIGNRELWRTPIPELLQLRAHYRATVRRLRAKERGQSVFGQTIKPLL